MANNLSIKDLRAKNKDELLKIMFDCKKELFNFRLQTVSGTLNDKSKIGKNKKTVAKIKTLLNNMRLKNNGVKNA